MKTGLGFALWLVLNTAIAIVGTAFIVSVVPYRHVGLLGPELPLSVVIAGALGVAMRYLRKSDNSSLWVWVCPAAWFVVGLFLRHHFAMQLPEAHREGAWQYAFAVPFVRCASFSLAAVAAGATLPDTKRELNVG
jgi:hypothetical protein